tara:strand:+ start:460 stop:621 length:162 start_codon:yes stop_codon:yes gene_type:complete
MKNRANWEKMGGEGLAHYNLDPFGKRIPKIAKDVILYNLYEMLVYDRTLGRNQ